MTGTTRRGVAALLALAGAVPAGVSAASGALPTPLPAANPDHDARLVRLAVEMAAAEEELNNKLAVAGHDSDLWDRAAEDYNPRITPLLEEMAATPAASLVGAAAKMGRLCASMGESGARSLQIGEPEVLDSLTDDLRRLLPVVMAPGGIGPNPDAELIAACARYPVVSKGFNDHGGEDKNNPLWLAYCEVRDIIDTATPQTMAGMLAKARAAKWQASHAQLDGEENPDGTPAAHWSYDLVNDLLRLVGGAA